jgi:hypothetical protein
LSKPSLLPISYPSHANILIPQILQPVTATFNLIATITI